MVRSTSPHPRRPAANLRVEPLEARVLLDAAGLLDNPLPLPPQFQLINHGRFLTSPSAAPAQEIARGFLLSQASRVGLAAADLNHLLVTRDFVDSVIGATHLTFQQTLHGLPVFNANVSINVSSRGEVINAAGGFVSQLDRFAAALARPALSPVQAVEAAARQLDVRLADFSIQEYPVTLQYVALPSQGVVLTWNFAVHMLDGAHWYNVHADAATGNVVSILDWVSHFDNPSDPAGDHQHGSDVNMPPGQQGGRSDGASYNVYSRWVPSPDWGPRLMEVNPSDPYPSPYGWHDTNGQPGPEFTDTRGNNVDARRNNVRPDGGATLTFDFPIDFTQQPTTYLPAATTNLFYWNNFLHDVHMRYGFSPAARNFQTNTYGEGGIGNDRVNANAQANGLNNANFSTPPDGMSGTMNMFPWNRTTPMRDGDLDNLIIVHEYGHGVSNRLTGNANGLGAVQSRGMGEGWSDWWGLMFTSYYEQEALWGRGAAPYVLGQGIFGNGIRRFPYSYQTAIHPLTLGSYNSTQAVHATGEVWANTLWGMNHLLIQKHGFNIWPDYGWSGQGDAGNVVALQLVMLGLMLQPNNPSFTAARNAILAADVALTGGDNQVEIWTAFARRGFGYSMVSGAATSTSVTEAFDMPPGLAPGGGAPSSPGADLVPALLSGTEAGTGQAILLNQQESQAQPGTPVGIEQQLVTALQEEEREAIQGVNLGGEGEEALPFFGLEQAAWDLFSGR